MLTKSHTIKINFEHLKWLFLSIGREVLSIAQPENILPWAEYECPDKLFALNWQELNISPENSRLILNKLCLFFAIEKLNAIEKSPLEDLKKIWAQWSQGARELNFLTSGSTGIPKNNIISEQIMLTDVQILDEILPKCKSIISVVNIHHSYGFSLALLLSSYRNVPLKLCPPLPTMLAKYFEPEAIIVGFPFFWNNIVRYGQAISPHLQPVYCLCATAPCSDDLENSLNTLGYDKFYEIYGSSETAAIGFRATGEQVFRLLPQWKLDNYNTNSTLFHISALEKPFKHSIPDYLEWITPNTFKILGRQDKAVQVAGVNVYIEHIINFLNKHDNVQACAVRLMRPDEGMRLKAFIVPKPKCNIAILRKELKKMLKELSAPERPATFTFGSALPRNVMGKLSDW